MSTRTSHSMKRQRGVKSGVKTLARTRAHILSHTRVARATTDQPINTNATAPQHCCSHTKRCDRGRRLTQNQATHRTASSSTSMTFWAPLTGLAKLSFMVQKGGAGAKANFQNRTTPPPHNKKKTTATHDQQQRQEKKHEPCSPPAMLRCEAARRLASREVVANKPTNNDRRD
jgi:hypothetical protein